MVNRSLTLVACLLAFASPAFAETKSNPASRSIGSDTLGAEVSTQNVLESAPDHQAYHDVKRATIKILGRRFSFLEMRGDRTQQNGSPWFSGGFSVGVNGSSIGTGSIHGGFQKSVDVLKFGQDFDIGPIPVYVEFAAAVSINITPSQSANSIALSEKLSVAGKATAAVGISFAYAGIRGTYSPLALTITESVTVAPHTIIADVKGALGWWADLSLVAHLDLLFTSFEGGISILSGSGNYNDWVVFRAMATSAPDSPAPPAPPSHSSPAPAPAPSAPTSSGPRVLRQGMSGSDVATLQSQLKRAGYFPAAQTCTGYFGPITAKAVRDFQRDFNLTVDGIAGPQTMAALRRALVNMRHFQ